MTSVQDSVNFYRESIRIAENTLRAVHTDSGEGPMAAKAVQPAANYPHGYEGFEEVLLRAQARQNRAAQTVTLTPVASACILMIAAMRSLAQ